MVCVDPVLQLWKFCLQDTIELALVAIAWASLGVSTGVSMIRISQLLAAYGCSSRTSTYGYNTAFYVASPVRIEQKLHASGSRSESAADRCRNEHLRSASHPQGCARKRLSAAECVCSAGTRLPQPGLI